MTSVLRQYIFWNTQLAVVCNRRSQWQTQCSRWLPLFALSLFFHTSHLARLPVSYCHLWTLECRLSNQYGEAIERSPAAQVCSSTKATVWRRLHGREGKPHSILVSGVIRLKTRKTTALLQWLKGRSLTAAIFFSLVTQSSIQMLSNSVRDNGDETIDHRILIVKQMVKQEPKPKRTGAYQICHH